VSKLGQNDLIFIDAGVKINVAYHRDVLPTQSYCLQCVRSVPSFFYLPTMQCFCCCLPSVQDIQPFGMRDICVYFIRPLATQE